MPSRKIVGRGRVEQLKEHERRFLDILEPQIVGFPSGRLVQTEAPDFIVTALKRKIGIEVTKIQQHQVLIGQGDRSPSKKKSRMRLFEFLKRRIP